MIEVGVGQAHLHANGLKIARDMVVDAKIINAPSSTKNRNKTRVWGDQAYRRQREKIRAAAPRA